jgi:glucosylglycerate synthase
MEEESVLTDEFLRQLINVDEVDILVGLPTHNNAKTIGSLVHTIQSGILRSFPRERAVVLNADGGSRDGTPGIITSLSTDDMQSASNPYALHTLHTITLKYGSNQSSEGAFRTILAAAEFLRAKACVVLSPEDGKIQTEWLSGLLGPAHRGGFDLVIPIYQRHAFEGLLTTNLLYPLTRALYGLRIREPYSPVFGFSGCLGNQFLKQNAWSDETYGGPVNPLSFTLAAIRGKFRICQTFLGQKEAVEPGAADLVSTLRHSVGVLFSALESSFDLWSAVSGSQEVPTPGGDVEFGLAPLRANRKRMREMFVMGVSELESVFQVILSPSTLAEVKRIASMDEEKVRYPAELWVRTVYEFATAYRKSVINRDHIIQALAPLFRGRAFTFVAENRTSSTNDIAINIEGLCLEFERLKPYLLEMWKIDVVR